MGKFNSEDHYIYYRGQESLGRKCPVLDDKLYHLPASLVVQMVRNLPAILGSIPGSGRSSVEGNGYPLQYSCLENLMDSEAWEL